MPKSKEIDKMVSDMIKDRQQIIKACKETYEYIKQEKENQNDKN